VVVGEAEGLLPPSPKKRKSKDDPKKDQANKKGKGDAVSFSSISPWSLPPISGSVWDKKFSVDDARIKALLLPSGSNFTIPDSTIDLFLQHSMKRHLQEASMFASLHERHIPNTKATLSKVQENSTLMEKVVKAGEVQLNAVKVDLLK